MHLIISALIALSFLTLIIFLYDKDKAALKHEVKNIEFEINQIICNTNEYISCSSMFYYEETEEIELYFCFENYGQVEDSELEEMCRVAECVSEYVNNTSIFLCGKKIILGSEWYPPNNQAT